MTFDEICEFIISRIERGYSNDPRDNGGETKWGISVRAHPELNGRIAELTIEEAKKIYREDYYTPSQISKFPTKMRLSIMDGAINHGIFGYKKRKIPGNNHFIQRALNHHGARLEVDGIVGPKTLAAAKACDPVSFVAAHARVRLDYYRKLDDYSWAGQGWENRVLLICSGS